MNSAIKVFRTARLIKPIKHIFPRRMSSKGNKDLFENQVIKDHEELKEFYQQYKSTGDMKWYSQFVWELCRHSVGEELVLYPLMETFGKKGTDLAEEGRQDHQKAKELLEKLEGMTRGPKADFDSEFDKLMSDLEKHMSEEESKDLSLLCEKCDEKERLKLGKKFANRKAIAPTRPHSSVPMKPVLLEEAMGLVAAPIDKFRDMFRDFPEESERAK